LQGEGVRRGAYEMKSLLATGEWLDQKLNISQVEWTDAAGAFSGRASWNALTQEAAFQAQSSLDAKQFLDAFGLERILADATFAAAPTIELSGSANFSAAAPRRSVTGRVVLERFAYKTVPLLNLVADFSWDGQRTMLRDVRVRHETGELLADVLDAPGDFRLKLESTINPSALRAFASAGLGKFLGEWEWPRSPAVRLAFAGPARDPKTWSGEGTVALQRTRFRGFWLNSATADVRLADGAVTFDNFRVVRDEGVGAGSFTYDFTRHEVRLAQVKTTLRPTEAIYWIDPKLFKVVAPYKFRNPPSVTANGVVQFRGGQDSRLELAIEAPAGMDYVFLGKTLPFDRISARVLYTKDRVQLSDVQGVLFDGLTRGKADISLAKQDPRYTAAIAVEGVDFPRLTDLYFKYETARGELSGTYDWQGLGDDARNMRGAGKIKVSNGDVFAIPVFGPLSGLVSAILPGAGYSVAKQATASFTIKEGVIQTKDFKVSGKLFGMVGGGEIHFLDNKLDFDVRIDAKGPGVLLTPVYELFEYKGEGSLSKPNWHPKRF
jgi:hypothetical protein